MNKMKKLLALALAGAMTLTLMAGCGKTEQPVETPKEPITAEEVDLSVLTEPVEFVSGLKPDTVVAKVGEYDITAAMLLYWFNYSVTYAMQEYYYAGQSDVDWAADMGEGVTVGEAVLNSALELAAYYTLLPNKAADDYALTPDAEELAAVTEELAAAAEHFGSEEDARRYMWMNMTDTDLYGELVAAASLETQLQEKLFGEGGELEPTDAQLLAYAEETLGYYGAKHILMLTVDMNKPVYAEDGSLAGFESLGEAVEMEKKALADDLKARLDAAADPVELFDSLMNEYSEDTGLAAYPDGYTAYKGQMVPEFEQAALAMAEGEISGVVESLYGYHIVMRTPLAPDDYVNQYVASQLDVLAQEWMSENTVQPNETFENMDGADAAYRMLAMQEAIYMDLYPEDAEASAETPEGEGEAQPQA